MTVSQTKIYVGNLPYNMDESALQTLFSEYGEVVEAKIITDRETGRSKGFGFVTFNDAGSMNKALEANEMSIEGRTLKVSQAKEKEKRSTIRG